MQTSGNSGQTLGNSGTKSGKGRKTQNKSTTTTATTTTRSRAPLQALVEPSQDSLQDLPPEGTLEIPEEPDRCRDHLIICTNINLS
jgi:hypothetical protein